MSEPKPTTGEWTVEDVILMGVDSYVISKQIADAHKAALVAERERFEMESRIQVRALEQAEQQLAAERNEASKRSHELFLAEQQIQQLRAQLAAAQAWIKEARNYHRDWPHDLSSDSDGTAALAAAIAEAQEPLVDAIREALASSNPEQVLRAALAKVGK